MGKFSFLKAASILVAIGITTAFAQKIETVNNVRTIHNEKSGEWGKNPQIQLEFVKTLGDIESDDENILFYMPSDIAFDGQGNVYVLDSGNHRVQKFSPDGAFVKTFGSKGQGPGEFYFPGSLDIDSQGNIYVEDTENQRIQILNPDGHLKKTVSFPKTRPGTMKIFNSGQILMRAGNSLMMGFDDEDAGLGKLFKVMDDEGKISSEFGEMKDFKDILANRMGNSIHFALDQRDNIYIAFDYQNRIEKYSPKGELLWRTDRKLPYKTDVPVNKGTRKGSGGEIRIEMPEMNQSSAGIAVDAKGRIWVATLKRQIKEDEEVQTRMSVAMGPEGRSMSKSVEGNTDMRETDMFHLEIYAPDGILLGKIPVSHFVDDIYIHEARIYLLDANRGMQFFVYNIVEK